MKTSILLTVLAGLAASAFAAPAPVASASEYPEGTVVEKYPTGLPKHLIPRALGLEKRANAGVYLCNDRNFAGYCVHIVAPMYQCVPLGGDLNDQVSSVGPDSPNYCFFFSANGCQDSEGHFGTYAPGYPDLNSIHFNDKISSYYCNPN